ncbi:Odorant receptor 46a isoform A [Bienertia sinuspersici]
MGILGRREHDMSLEKWHMAHTYILFNEDEVTPYINRHMNLLKMQNRKANSKALATERRRTFHIWFKGEVMKELQCSSQTISDRLKSLAYGPNFSASFFSGYAINGYTFYTRDQDDKSTMQNSGVCVEAEAMHLSSAKDNQPVYSKMLYYGVIEEICEVHYMGFSIPMFCCKWVDNNNNVVCDGLGHTTMNMNKIGQKEDPYILASQAKQVFYVTDPCDKRKSVAVTSKPRHVIDINDDNISYEERFTPSEVQNVDDSFDDAPTYIRRDHEEGIWDDNETSKANRSKKRRRTVSANEAFGTDEANEEVEESAECENRRGRTVLAVVGKAILSGVKIPVEWNHNKVPVGENRATFVTYIGVVARERVNINYREWEDVPKEVLDELYNFITRGFTVPEERRNYVFGRASIRWRAFKARLRKDWMYDTKGANKHVIIKKPPSMYPFITQNDWNKFIETYTDDKFKKALEAQQFQGEIDASGRNDILARALKTPEHGGCVRGVGSGVTNKHYFGYNKPTPQSQLQSDLKYVKSKLENVVNTQNLLLSYLVSSGQVNAEQLKEFDESNGNQVSHQLASIQVGGSGGQGLGGHLGGFGSSGDQGLQGFSLQLASQQNKVSHQLAGVQVGGSGGHVDGFGLGGDQECQGFNFQLPSEQNKDQDFEIQPETYHVAWPEAEYVPEKENSLSHMLYNEQVITDQPFPKGVDSLCSLAIKTDNGVDIVAVGEVYVGMEGEVVKHHFKPVPSGHYRVCIKEEINPSAPLPCPEGEIRFICQGKELFLIWPTHLVFPIKKDKADNQFNKEITAPSPRSPSSQSSCTRRHMSETVYAEGISGLYGFCDCNYLSPHTPTVEKDDDRCDYLARVFSCNDAKNKNQLFFAPYNEE